MKKLLLGIVLMAVMAVSAAAVDPVDSVDFTGNTHASDGFGPRAETGNYGAPDSAATSCEMVWEIGCEEGQNNATFQLDSDGYYASTLTIRHLDGLADDSFKVEIQNADLSWTDMGSYGDKGNAAEVWTETSFDIPEGRSGLLTFRITATDGEWAQCDTYGQLALDWAELYGGSEIPEFGTLAAMVALAGAVTGFFVIRKK